MVVLKVGDVVEMLCGGPKMVVFAADGMFDEKDDKEEQNVKAAWHHTDGALEVAVFDRRVLRLIEAVEVP